MAGQAGLGFGGLLRQLRDDAADEAAALLARLAGRPGIRAADGAVGEIARLCGCLPLAIGMLAGQLRHHPARDRGVPGLQPGRGRDDARALWLGNAGLPRV